MQNSKKLSSQSNPQVNGRFGTWGDGGSPKERVHAFGNANRVLSAEFVYVY